jgi:hypothetical protein
MAKSTNEEFQFRAIIMIKCKCGVWATIGEKTDGNQLGVLHPIPECDLFTKLDAVDYVTYLRKMYEPN